MFLDTHHLINQEPIERVRDGVILIHTSRGGLVDTVALIKGLKSGKVGLAGLDVYEEETGIFFNDMSDRVLTDDVLARLLTFNNVVVNSHQAFLTHDVRVLCTSSDRCALQGDALYPFQTPVFSWLGSRRNRKVSFFRCSAAPQFTREVVNGHKLRKLRRLQL